MLQQDDDLTCTNVDIDWDALQPVLQALSPGNWPPPRLLHALPSVAYVFQLGAVIAGIPDPTAFAGMNNSHIFTSNFQTGLSIRALPVTFAQPLDFASFVDDNSIAVLGPVTHGKTVSLGMAPWDANTIVVTGWPSIINNTGTEAIYFTSDGGSTWTNIFGNLFEACYNTAVVPGNFNQPPVRPSSPVLIDVLWPDSGNGAGPSAVLIGTSTGVYFTHFKPGSFFGDTSVTWVRVGTCADFPLVIVEGISYEAYSDTLVVASFGRGVYYMHNVKNTLAGLTVDQETGSCLPFPTWFDFVIFVTWYIIVYIKDWCMY